MKKDKSVITDDDVDIFLNDMAMSNDNINIIKKNNRYVSGKLLNLYHGTSCKNAEIIKENGFKPSIKTDYSEYGLGVYFSFFKENAETFGQIKKNKNKDNDYCLIKIKKPDMNMCVNKENKHVKYYINDDSEIKYYMNDNGISMLYLPKTTWKSLKNDIDIKRRKDLIRITPSYQYVIKKKYGDKWQVVIYDDNVLRNLKIDSIEKFNINDKKHEIIYKNND
jgi:hypothetical protein